MLLSILCLVSLLGSWFSAVLSTPETSFNRIPNEEGSSTLDDVISIDKGIPLISSIQVNSDDETLQNSGLKGLSSGDSSEFVTKNLPLGPHDDGSSDLVDANPLTANTFLLAQGRNRNTPQEIQNTPGEQSAQERAWDWDRVRESPFDPEDLSMYKDEYCNGGRWACCKKIQGQMKCRWMAVLALVDRINCPIRACCWSTYVNGPPDEYCPDSPRGRQPVEKGNETPQLDPGATEGTGARSGGSGVGAGVLGGGAGGADP
ncbi:hypothetical protein MMC07_004444 [Pseudocyphellaria aurata]|nr:hypothetical protein [Pseudocyphellaria aurata]